MLCKRSKNGSEEGMRVKGGVNLGVGGTLDEGETGGSLERCGRME